MHFFADEAKRVCCQALDLCNKYPDTLTQNVWGEEAGDAAVLPNYETFGVGIAKLSCLSCPRHCRIRLVE